MHKHWLRNILTRVLSTAVLGTSVHACVADPGAADARENSELTQPATERSLAGSSWRLVQIMSMDDSTYVPSDGSLYTLTFNADGSAAIRADCNRAAGSWVSDRPSALTFGEIAATQAECPPGSLHDRYMAQFPWVQSYVMRDGNLFLATMADGSIIEFEPAPVAATVFGKEIRTDDPEEMQQVVLTRLFDHYANEQGIEVTDAELDRYVATMQRGMREDGLTADDDLTPEEAREVEDMRREMGYAMIRQWKINKALYDEYGGRIVYQQLGPEPLDAYRRYIEERAASGDFEILNESMADPFWRYFTDESMHTFYEPGSEEEARAFAAPPWD